MRHVLRAVSVVAGDGSPAVTADVAVDDGVLVDLSPTDAEPAARLVPSAVDLHLDNVRERRRPRATVELDPGEVVTALDAECAAAGIGVVCIAARCEESPGKGVAATDAARLAEAVEALAPHLACDWRLHVRVEVTDDAAVDAAGAVLAASSRVALVSMMEHSAERTRFASIEEHRRFYAADWGVTVEEVDEILRAQQPGAADRDARRREVASLAAGAGVVLASHDDRHPGDVDGAAALGARIAEFPLTLAAAAHAHRVGMLTVLGAPNAVRGRSTSPGNLLVADALASGGCDALCSDYLPSSLQAAVAVLAERGACGVEDAVDLVSGAPARAIGIDPPTIAVGVPLTATLRARRGGVDVGLATWRGGRLVHSRLPR